MYKLNGLMEKNYRDHPAFNFGVGSLNAPLDKISAFNELYQLARNTALALNKTGRSRIHKELRDRLDEVFDVFQTQAADEYEGRFFHELKNTCVRLLNDEFEWYARPRRSGFVEFNDEETLKNAILMQRDTHFFGCLPSTAVVELQTLAEGYLVKFRANADAGRLRREDLSVNSGPSVRRMRDVLNREFRALGVLDAVSAYSGHKTKVQGLALEFSVSNATWWRNVIDGLERPPQTMYTHIDETIACPKSIVYLSDVSEQNGPTSCYPGTYESMQLNPLQEMIGRVVGLVGSRVDSPLNSYYSKSYHQSVNSEGFRRHFMRLPACLRFNSHMGWDVLPGSELESELVSNEQKMIGAAGTFIAFDGARLFHRGGMVQSGERLALQVIFSDLTLSERAISKFRRMVA